MSSLQGKTCLYLSALAGGLEIELGSRLRELVYLADFTFTLRRLFATCDVQLGLRNAFNRRYSDPVALFARVDRMPQRGRAFFVRLSFQPAR